MRIDVASAATAGNASFESAANCSNAMCASVRDRWSPPRARSRTRERAQAAARACGRLQSRALDADALRRRHATRPPRPFGLPWCAAQCALECHVRSDRANRESERSSGTIGTIGERVYCGRLKLPVVPRPAMGHADAIPLNCPHCGEQLQTLKADGRNGSRTIYSALNTAGFGLMTTANFVQPLTAVPACPLNCPKCDAPMTPTRRKTDGQVIAYHCDQHGHFWPDEQGHYQEDRRHITRDE